MSRERFKSATQSVEGYLFFQKRMNDLFMNQVAEKFQLHFENVLTIALILSSFTQTNSITDSSFISVDIFSLIGFEVFTVSLLLTEGVSPCSPRLLPG